jgi:predicted DCC family thiol-disulfide oxidoreductase YuxK
MRRPRQPRSVSSTGQHLVLYDGECVLCNGAVRAILARDRREIFHFAALQSHAARAMPGRSPDNLDTFYVVVKYRETGCALLTRGRAALFVMTALGWPWSAGGLLRVLPTALLDSLYDVVARNRYRIFGRERCQLVPPAHRTRFIDAVDALDPPRSMSSGRVP